MFFVSSRKTYNRGRGEGEGVVLLRLTLKHFSVCRFYAKGERILAARHSQHRYLSQNLESIPRGGKKNNPANKNNAIESFFRFMHTSIKKKNSSLFASSFSSYRLNCGGGEKKRADLNSPRSHSFRCGHLENLFFIFHAMLAIHFACITHICVPRTHIHT